MIVPVWCVAFAGLCIFLTGVSGEIDSPRTVPSPGGRQENSNGKSSVSSSFVQSANDVFAFACASVCGNAGKVLECELKTNGDCAKRYYVVCKGKDQCQWETVRSSCEEEKTDSGQCEKLLRNREEEQEAEMGKLKKTSETGISYLRSIGIVPALRRKLNSVRRRDLGEQQLYSARSGMTMTSGNGHAYALDGNKLVESHYGRPAMFTSLQGSDMYGYPYPFVSPFQNFNHLGYNGGSGTSSTAAAVSQGEQAEAAGAAREPNVVAAGPPQTVNNWSGYQSMAYSPMNGYNSVPPYQTVYQQPNKYSQAYAYGTDGRYQPNDQYNIWGSRGKPYSLFSNFFNAVGLQDPMLMLQYLPVG